MMSVHFPSSFEESNPTKKQVIERWLLANVDDGPVSARQCHVVCYRNSTSFYLISLPDTRKWHPEFKARVLSAIVDHAMKESLVKSGLINWCRNVRSLMPIHVPTDGNCLLHAVATAVWGISDKNMMLRRLLCLALGIDQEHRFRGRWLHHRQRQITQFVDKLLGSGNELMDKEWAEIRQCLEPDRFQDVPVPHHSLEPIHVYTLANILRRPVIILSDTGRTVSGLSLQDSDMGGIYLPLEWSWMDTCRVPILLGYSRSHFSPLMFADHPNQMLMETSPRKDLTPLVNSHFEQFPVRFLLQGEEPEVGHLLRKYLKVRETVMQVNEQVQNVLCAELEVNVLPAELDLITDYIQDCELRFQQNMKPSPQHQSLPGPAVAPQVVNENRLWVSAPNQQQGTHTPEYGLGDPTLHTTGGAGHQIHIPPPSFQPGGSFAVKNVSLNPSPDQKCKMPGCKFFGDPDLGMMCSSCFRNYTIRESRYLAAGEVSPHPSAPLASIPAEETGLQLSMMNERCKEKCGYRCSTKTYPYCHECANKRQKETQAMAMATAFESAMVQQSSGQSSGGPGSERPQESGEVRGNAPMMNASLNIPSPGQPHVGCGLPGMTEAGPPPKKTLTVSAAQDLEEITRALVTGDLPCPVPGTEDPNALLLFGSGQASAVTSNHPGQEGSAIGVEPQTASSLGLVNQTSGMAPGSAEVESGGAEQNTQQTPSSPAVKEEQQLFSSPAYSHDLSSAACLAKSQMNPPALAASAGDAHTVCTNQGCSEPAIHNSMCGKCYVGQNMKSTEYASLTEPMENAKPASLTEQKIQMMSFHSSPSSAPASVGPVCSIPKSNATYTKEAGAFSQPESRSQPSSLRDLRNIPPMNYTQSWIQDNRFVESQGLENAPTQPGGKSPPQGLPEKPESEGLGNDLIASGAECFSSTQRCIGESCGNRVSQAGQLCQQCQDILRRARLSQGHGASASGQAAQTHPEQQPCRTERCTYYGIPENVGYCTRCYRRHVEREVSEERHRHGGSTNIQSPSPSRQPSRTISVPPEFNYVRMPSERQGQLCMSAGCRLFGDPKQGGMCFTHYQQHLASIAKATRGVKPASKRRNNVTNVAYAPEVYITPSSVTVITPGEVFPPPQVSVSPPPVPTAVGAMAGSREPSLGETYYRVAGRYTGNCLNPTCTNYGNRSKGGLCNNCAQQQKVTDDLINRAIYGEEETG